LVLIPASAAKRHRLEPFKSKSCANEIVDQSSLVTSAVFLGMLFGGIIGTVMGDKYGRRVLMIVCLAVNGVSGLCAAASPTLVWMSFFRFVAGVGIGGIAPMLFAVCLEHVPASARGKYITIISAFWMLVRNLPTLCFKS
ncbi:hypothetical protein DYB38_006837, partial [Aphanomyces astaci]